MRARTVRRVVAPLALALTLSGLAAAPSTAITGNAVPDHEHPYVGLVIVYDADGAFVERCTGSLVSPTVLVTAGHCVVADAAGDVLVSSARIWFEQDAGVGYDPATGTPAPSGYPSSGGVTAHAFHAFEYAAPTVPATTNDLGLVVLDEPVALDRYATLPALGAADRASGPKPRVTLSGYGVSYVNGNPTKTVEYRSRLMTGSFVVGTGGVANDRYVQLSSGLGRDGGGTCFGDSGGPALLQGTDTMLGVSSFGLSRKTCTGTSFAFRVDTPAAQDWMRSVLTPQQWSEIRVASA